jgi:hypothetical protein
MVEPPPGLAPPDKEISSARRDDATAPVTATAAAPSVDPDRAPVIVSGDMRDVTVDRQGRVWAMSTTTIALVADR